MPHNFHDTNGWLIVSMDMHRGLHWPVPLPTFMQPMNFGELVCAHPFTMSPGGDRNPTVLILARIAETLDVKVSDLVQG